MLEHISLDEDGYYYEEIDGEVTKKITTKDEFAVVNPACLEEIVCGHRRFMVGFQGGDNGHSVKLCLLGEDILASNVQV